VSLTYSSYLKLDELLAAQNPLSEGPEHDELLFIVIHQVYELWFKVVIQELEHLRQAFDNGQVASAYATLKRILTIFKTLVGQIDILETMSPLSFRSFRDRLESSSGFQSGQYREIEMLLGKRSKGILKYHPEGSELRVGLERRLCERGVFHAFVAFLGRRYKESLPDELVQRDCALPWEESPELQDLLLKVYREDPEVAQVCEMLVDLDEGLQEWRYRHVKMVERTIGHVPGTGGSPGVAYLKETLFKPLFPDLWAIRAKF
jgi:tryptophan 2,3-dioxygenase